MNRASVPAQALAVSLAVGLVVAPASVGIRVPAMGTATTSAPPPVPAWGGGGSTSATGPEVVGPTAVDPDRAAVPSGTGSRLTGYDRTTSTDGDASATVPSRTALGLRVFNCSGALATADLRELCRLAVLLEDV